MKCFGKNNDHTSVRFRHCLCLDFYRSMISYQFLFSVGVFFIWMFLSCTEDMKERLYAYSLADYISNACVGVDNFSLLIFAIATFPYAWSYCSDKQNGFLVPIRLRVGTGPYGLARTICAAAVPFLAVQCALGFFSLFLLSMGVDLNLELSSGVGPYTALAVNGHFILFYFVRSSLTGLTCALASEFGLMVTAFFSNSYYALAAPMFGYYSVDIIQTFTYQIFRINYGPFWINQIFFGRPFPNYVGSYLWALGWMMILTILCGWIFCRRISKEFQT